MKPFISGKYKKKSTENSDGNPQAVEHGVNPPLVFLTITSGQSNLTKRPHRRRTWIV